MVVSSHAPQAVVQPGAGGREGGGGTAAEAGGKAHGLPGARGQVVQGRSVLLYCFYKVLTYIHTYLK